LKDLEGDHTRICAKKIADISGLIRAVLYKSHLRPVWDRTWSKLERERQNRHNTDRQFQELKKHEDQIVNLEQKLKKMEYQNERLLYVLEKEKSRSTVYRQEYEEHKGRHAKLLHHNLRLLRRLHLYGIETDEFDEKEDVAFDPQ
jgi:predicted RNase H-like nuclease (RuvC/YqgF family)